MNVLTRTGKVLLKNGNALSQKPYAQKWGFYQTKQDGKASAYDFIYECLKDGFSVPERDGGIYDGANASIYHVNCHWLTIPLSSFGLTKAQAYKVLSKVCDDNEELLAFVYLPEFDAKTVVENGIVTSTQICLAVDSERSAALATMQTVVSALDNAIAQYVDGVSFDNLPTTEEQKKKVVKVIHDWILKKSNFASSTRTSYWQATAFAPLSTVLDVDAHGYDGEPVQCSGISRAIQYMCRRYGINCIYVMGGVGTGTGGATSEDKNNHAWNMVDFNHPVGIYSNTESDWCGMDATMDEHIDDGEMTIEGASASSWTFFLNSDTTYHDTRSATINDHPYTLDRANNDMGYPVAQPSANFKYDGSQYYEWDE